MNQQKSFQLPPANPNFPLLTRVITSPLLPDHGREPLVWALGAANPLDSSETTIRRMFIQDGGVLVYFTGMGPQGGAVCATNFIPMHSVRLVEETMSPEVFVEDMAVSESRGDDEGDDDDEDDVPPGPAPANGQASV